MPDLSFSSTNSITASWTCQQLISYGTNVNVGYDVKAPKAPAENKKEDK